MSTRLASWALRALAEVPDGSTLAGLLRASATDRRLATAAGVKRVPVTTGTDGRTLDAHVQEAIHIALAARTPQAPQLRAFLFSLGIMRALSTRSQFGGEWDPALRRDDALAIAQTVTPVPDPAAQLAGTLLELRRAGLIVTPEVDDSAEPAWEAIGPAHFFFCRTDGLFQHWDPQADAKEICRRADTTRVVNSAELDARLGWGPRRLNSAATYAQLRCWITVPYRRTGGAPYVLPYAYVTEQGKVSGET